MNQPLAYVHPGAKIAKNVVIEPFTTNYSDNADGGSSSSRFATNLARPNQLLQEHAEVAEEEILRKNLCALCVLL